MNTTIYFVRHAHSDYTPEELTRPLTERGIVDAKHVTEKLQNEDIHYVISSPYKRAIQTVEGIAKLKGKDIIIEEDFKERVLSGSTVDDFNDAIYQVWADYNFSFAGGESNHMAQQRGKKALYKILEVYKHKNIVIGTHGNIMVLMMNYFDNSYDYNFWKTLDMPDIYKLSFHGIELKEVNRLWDKRV